MSTITALVGGDGITTANSMTKINTNFSNLNTDKMETSVLDTDTTLAANSDAKVATQKAVKAYVDAGGNVNASTTTKGIVEEATVAEIAAGTAAGGTGARLFVNPSSTVSTSAGAGDVGKVPRLNASGQLDTTFLPGATYKNGVIGRTRNAASGAVTTAHGLGTTPRYIRITAKTNSTSSLSWWQSSGVYNGTTVSCVYQFQSSTAANDLSGTDTTNIVRTIDNSSNDQAAVPTFDATNITLTWTKSGTPSSDTIQIMWEAFA